MDGVEGEQGPIESAPDVIRELEAVLDERLGAFGETIDEPDGRGRELSDADRSHLENLGYL